MIVRRTSYRDRKRLPGETDRGLPKRPNPRDKTEGFLLVGADVYKDAQFAAEDDGWLR